MKDERPALKGQDRTAQGRATKASAEERRPGYRSIHNVFNPERVGPNRERRSRIPQHVVRFASAILVGLSLAFVPFASLRAQENDVRKLQLQVERLTKEVAQLRAELEAIKNGLKSAVGIQGSSADQEGADAKALRELKELLAKVEKEGVPAYVATVDAGSVKQRLKVRNLKIGDFRQQTSLIAPFSADVKFEGDLYESDVFSAQRDAEEATLPGEATPIDGYFRVDLTYREGKWEARHASQIKSNREIVSMYPSELRLKSGTSELAKRWYTAFGGNPPFKGEVK